MAFEMNRRSFLTTAAVTAGVAAMGAGTVALADEAAEEAPAEGGDYDVVVIGMGGAGMCASIAAKEAGVEKVALLEMNAVVGGCTNFSSSGMNAAETQYQADAGIDDTIDLFISDTMTGGHNMNNLELVTKLCTEAKDGITWLGDHGIVLSDVTSMGGASVPRCHRPADRSAVGGYMVPLLQEATEAAGVEVFLEHRAIELLKGEDGAVNGVVAQDADGNEVTFNAGAVILATGGFGANFDMIGMYRPDLVDFVTTNASGSQGDGMVMAQAAGANLINMDQIQTHPTVYITEGSTTGSLVGEAVRGSGAILINQEGNRFTDEQGTRDVVSAAELEQPEGKVWVLYDQTLYDNTPVTATYESRGMSLKGETLEELCDQIGVDAATLQSTIDTYNAAVEAGGEGDPFGRTTGLGVLTTAPWYAIPVSPGIHHCMGGVYINTDSQALSIRGEVIPGLYAAGETTGGIHGSNRLGGNAVADIVVMGINAGKKAAEYVLA